MPDNWEYPWYAAWDLAFHMIPFARVDPHYAKEQLVLMLREWYMHPNGQMPAYEFAFGDVNPPVHAWACWRVYKMTGPRGGNATASSWGVFSETADELHLVGEPQGRGRRERLFRRIPRSGQRRRLRPLAAVAGQSAGAGRRHRLDGVLLPHHAFHGLELAAEDPEYEDVASKFFEHFVAIASAMNSLGGNGLWDEADGFYYDQLRMDGTMLPLRMRSVVGLMPLLPWRCWTTTSSPACPAFASAWTGSWTTVKDLCQQISYMEQDDSDGQTHRLLAIPSFGRLLRVLKYVLDENEFLSPYGIRSLSKFHQQHPYTLQTEGGEQRVDYEPAESTSGMFGGNSNWRGPIWFPVNYLWVEALERYHHFYGDHLRVECPTGSGRMMNLKQVAGEIMSRLSRIFLRGPDGRAPWQSTTRYAEDPNWRDLTLFYEFFHADNGRGLGASHQTGWTSLVVRCLEDMARRNSDNS
jgi:hypothetical protein